MEDLSLHILDVVENSIRAGADMIGITIEEDRKNDLLTLTIRDNGCGMDEAEAANAADPFYSTKEGKDFGLGISLLSQAAEETGGRLELISRQGRGTEIRAVFHSDHIDMKPVGDMEMTMDVLRMSHREINFHYDRTDETIG